MGQSDGDCCEFISPSFVRFLSLTYRLFPQLGRDLNKDSHIPPEIDDYAMYAPAFTLDVPAGFMADKNTPETMENVEKTFVEYIEQVRRRTAANAL